jgi:hypothetical protein
MYNLEMYVSVWTSGSFKPTLAIRIIFDRKMMALQIKSIYPYFKTYLCICYMAALKPEYSSRQNLVVAFFRMTISFRFTSLQTISLTQFNDLTI